MSYNYLETEPILERVEFDDSFLILVNPADKKPKPKRLAAAPAGFNLADITRFNGVEELEVDPTGKIPAQLSGAMNQNNNAIK